MIPNYDPAAGIHYGCISQHSLMPEAMSDIWDKARDLSYESAVEEWKSTLSGLHNLPDHVRDGTIASALKDFRLDDDDLAELSVIADGDLPAAEKTDAMWDIIEQEFNDHYECDQRSWLWEDEGYQLSNCLITDIFVGKSPYFTYAPECSPCVPNAGNLDSAFKGKAVPSGEYQGRGEDLLAEAQSLGWMKTYCLGHDMFEGGNAPYPVWSVETGKHVVMVETKVDCPNCNGTGRDSTARVASVRGVSEVDVLNDALTNPDRFPEFEEFGSDGRHSGKFKCCRCQGYGHSIERVQEEQE
jgi:hypothetical protein